VAGFVIFAEELQKALVELFEEELAVAAGGNMLRPRYDEDPGQKVPKK
jgi:hypothetical protein